MSLTANYTFVGRGNWSIDGVGGGGGTLSALVPDGSRIERAYLYGSTFGDGGLVNSAVLALGSDNTTVDSFVNLGNARGSTFFALQAYRADVTSFVREAIGDGDDDAFDFNISGISGSSVDGFGLVIVFSNPDESTRTISLLDGFSLTTGDEFELDFAEPVDTDQDGFEAQMSLGIGYSLQGDVQFSQVDVDGRRLTSSAGGQDDGSAGNGGLLTIGGLGDSADNPDPDATPAGDPRVDDELYDLAQGNADDETPYLADGSSGITVTTINPSNDDNIFFAGFNITAIVSVDTDENDAPVAVGDEVTVDEDDTVTFDVLGNDFDPDEDDEFSVTGIDTSGLEGTLTDNGDGSFTYDPDGEFDDLDEGEEATTSFTYTISDGEETATTTVTITVEGADDDEPEPPSDCPTVERDGTEDGSSSSDQVLTGASYHNTFYFGNGGDTGEDRIINFAADDILVTDLALRDNNGDGEIDFGSNGVLDLSGAGGAVAVDGVTALRFLGEACDGNFVYGASYVRPDGAQEGFVLTDDVLGGEETDSEADIFFFDTALDLDLGDDVVDAFGARDVLVTTTQILDSNNDGLIGFGADALLDLPGGVGGPGDPGGPGEGGTVSMTNNFGGTITSLEYDGSVTRDGVTYYVYSTVGSSAGVETLG